MRINQIKNNTKLTITIKQGKKQMDLETTVIELRDPALQRAFVPYMEQGYAFVVTKAIISGGKAVGFPNSSEIQYIASAVVDQESYYWTDIHCRLIQFSSGQRFHLFYSALNPAPMERRAAARLTLDVPAIATIGIEKTKYPVILQDLSISGMAVLFNPTVGLSVGQLVHLDFTASEQSFHTGGVIVRMQQTPKGLLVGCKLSVTNDALLKFVLHGNAKAGNEDRIIRS